MNTLTVRGFDDLYTPSCCGIVMVDNPPNVFGSVTATYNFTSVSEPSVLMLFGLGIIGLFWKISQRSLDGAELAERNPGSSPTRRMPASGLHPGYH